MSLRLRIAAIIFLIGTGVSVLTTWWAVSTSLEASRPQITRNESFLLEMLRDLSVDAALTGEYTRLQPYIDRIHQAPDILRGMLADRDGRVVVATSEDLVGNPLPERVDSDHGYWRVRDIEAAGERLGLLTVEFSTVALERLEQNAILNGMTIVGVGITLSLLLAWLGARSAVGRLTRLNHITRDIANGNTLVSAVIPGSDEVSQLSMSVQSLVARIEHAESERLSLRGGTDEIEQRLRAVAEAVPDPVIIKDQEGRWDEVNLAGQQLLRLQSLPWRGKTDEDLAILLPPLASFFRNGPGADQAAIVNRTNTTTEETIADPHGEERQFEIMRVPLFDTSGKPTGIALVGKDLSTHRLVHDRASGDRSRLNALMETVADAVAVADATGMVEALNRKAEHLSGWSSEDARGRPLSEVLPLLDNEAHRPLAEAVREAASHGGEIAGGNPVSLLHRDGSDTPVTANAGPIIDSEGLSRGQIVALRSGVAMHGSPGGGAGACAATDALTGLLNAHGFEQVLAQTLSCTPEQAHHHVLCAVDLNDFHGLNQTLGNFAADDLLRHIGRRLRAVVRGTDAIARLGADRFAVLLSHCPLTQAEQLATKLLRAVDDFRLPHGQESIAVTARVGVVPMSAAAPLAIDWLKAAEATCFAAKTPSGDSGDHDPAIRWDANWSARLARQHQDQRWTDRIHRAVRSGDFELYVQPARALKPSRPGYRELLLRLPGDDGKPITAARFLPIAERDRLSARIDAWVLDTVACAWREQRLPDDDGLLAINLSAASLTDDEFPQRVRTTLEDAGLPPGQVCFEVRASALVGDLGGVGRGLQRLAALGCRLTLDRVNADAAVFACFKNIEPDFVKLDGSLIAASSADTLAATLVESIHKAATIQGITTIAPWVEDAATLERVKRVGVGYVQGQGVEPVQPLESLARTPANATGSDA